MKGSGQAAASAAPAGKRRWRCMAAAGAAVALAFFSVVVPLAVLLGLHTRFPSSTNLTPPPKSYLFLTPSWCHSDPGFPSGSPARTTITGHPRW